MGALRFNLHPPNVAEIHPELNLAYVTGMDRMPWQTRVETSPGLLCCHRSVPESGAINVPWVVQDHGLICLKSTSLMEREQPYHLQVELARGKLCQLLNQAAIMDEAGLRIPQEIDAQIAAARKLFLSKVIGNSDVNTAAVTAVDATNDAISAGDDLTRCYSDLLVRMKHGRQSPLRLGCRLSPSQLGALDLDEFKQCFNTVVIDFSWRDVEPVEGQYEWSAIDRILQWCEENNMDVRGGPIIQWTAESLPDWLWLWEKDFNNLLSFMSDYVETVISRYRGRIRSWEVTSRTNCGEILSLGEEDRIRMTVRALRIAEAADSDVKIMITVGQPWGEYTARHDYQYSPLHFADALVRADLGISSIGLEMIMGYDNGSSFYRDLMECSALLDYYAMLGLPLTLVIAAPSAKGEDGGASTSWGSAGNWASRWNSETQAAWIDDAILLANGKPFIEEVCFTSFTDALPHDCPSAGLIDATGTPKQAMSTVSRFRQSLP